MNDLVSIITPCYNSARFIAQTIDSVLAQSYPFWEMIIVDDGSTDDSCDIVAGYLKKDPRIKHITLTQNNGTSKARNVAIKAAKGRYIAFLDSDDLWLAEKLTTQINFMRHHNVGFTYASYLLINENNEQRGEFITRQTLSYHDLLKTCSIGCLTAIYDTKMLGKMAMADTRRQDYALWLNILKKIPRAYGIKTPLAIYRLTPSSRSSNKQKSAVGQWHVYRQIEKLSLLKSSYYFLCYAFHGAIKYRCMLVARR